MKRPARATSAPTVRLPHPGEYFSPTSVSYTFIPDGQTAAVEQVEEGCEVYGVITNSSGPVLVCWRGGALGVAPEELRPVIIEGVRAVNQAGRLGGKVVEKVEGVIRVELEFMTSHVVEDEDLIRLESGDPLPDAGQLRRARESLFGVYESFMEGEQSTPFETRGRGDGQADLVLRTPRGFEPAATMVIAWPHPAARLAVRLQAAGGATK